MLTLHASTHFVLGNLCRAEREFEAAQQQYSKAQSVWLDCGQMKTHPFNGACLYKLGCVAFDIGDKDTALSVPNRSSLFISSLTTDHIHRKHLQEALVIAQLYQPVLSADHAPVLFKLSEVSESKGGARREDERMRNEARSLLSASSHLVTSELADEENAYDDMVYIL